MKVLLNVVVLLVIAIIAVGFYQGWFHVSTGSTDNTSSATVTVDQDKIRADEAKAREKVEEYREKAKDKAADRTDGVKEPERRP